MLPFASCYHFRERLEFHEVALGAAGREMKASGGRARSDRHHCGFELVWLPPDESLYRL